VPNGTHVFTRGQHLYLQYEIYDAAKGKVAVAAAATAATAPTSGGQPAQTEQSGHPQKDDPTRAAQTRESIHVLTSIEFLQGNVKVYESKQVAATEVTAPERKAVVFQIDLPLQSLKPGLYVCQVNVIDDVAGNFAFPRWPILIKDAAPAAAPVAQSSSSAH